MPNLPNQITTDIAELDEIVSSERLGQVFDQLEPRAKRLAQQPSAVSYGIVGGSLGVLLGIILGYIAWFQYGFPWYLTIFCTAALMAGGVAYGNIRARGKKAINLERKGQAIADFLRPIIPLLGKGKSTPEMKKVKQQLTNGVEAQIQAELGLPKESEQESAFGPPAPPKPYSSISTTWDRINKELSATKEQLEDQEAESPNEQAPPRVIPEEQEADEGSGNSQPQRRSETY